jgi:AcrR family transcriptional regulator
MHIMSSNGQLRSVPHPSTPPTDSPVSSPLRRHRRRTRSLAPTRQATYTNRRSCRPGSVRATAGFSRSACDIAVRRNRQQVLRTAQRLFARDGLGVPLDEIARRPGVGPGTVHRHFPTKKALDLAVAIELERLVAAEFDLRTAALDVAADITREVAYLLDRTRPASCALTSPSTRSWRSSPEPLPRFATPTRRPARNARRTSRGSSSTGYDHTTVRHGRRTEQRASIVRSMPVSSSRSGQIGRRPTGPT